ncbi:MAG: hypothetical protein GXP26_11385 [Planctomycetes bacterium]|nr:hypothetical protein [Planctomycetota bacterium]
MKTPASSTRSHPNSGTRKYQLSVNSYDRTATMLLALLLLVGATVLGLVIVFFANRTFPTIESIPVVPVEASSSSANQGFATEPDPPGQEDAPDLTEPLLQNTLEALANASSIQQAVLSDEAFEGAEEVGKGQGKGDARMAGPGGDGVVERVPRWERWKFRFEPKSAEEFARWLDYYKIEIGVLGRDNLVHYALDVSSKVPKTRTALPLEEKRGRTSAVDGPMPRLTMELARKANIAQQGPIVLMFYPFEVESILWDLEKKYAKDHSVNSIRETVFTVVRGRKGFSFEVLEQKYF